MLSVDEIFRLVYSLDDEVFVDNDWLEWLRKSL